MMENQNKNQTQVTAKNAKLEEARNKIIADTKRALETQVELSLSEAIDFIEDKKERKKYSPAEKAFLARLRDIPEDMHEERGMVYYYLLRTIIKSAQIFESEKAKSAYKNMCKCFDAQKNIYHSQVKKNPKDRIVRIQYEAFLRLVERHLYSLQMLYTKKDWQERKDKSYAKRMDYRRVRYRFEGKYLEYAFYEFLRLSSSYGENFWRWAFTVLICVLFFGGVVWGLDYAETGGAMMRITHTPMDYFYFSLVTFATLGYGDITPITIAGQIIVCIETLVGYTMLAMFVALIQRKFEQK